MKRLLSLLIICIALANSSCKKIIFDKDLASTNPYENFEYLWDQCDTKYSYFDVKKINWDSIKTVYAAKIYTGMTDDSLFNVLGSMLDVLRDDHTNLVSFFNVSSYQVALHYADNFDFRLIVDNYIHDYSVSGPFYHNFLDSGKIGYIYFPEFPGSVDNQNLDYVLNKYQQTQGLILDLRENGGGAISDMYSLLSRFVENKTLLFYSRIKSGPGHNDFTDPTPCYVSPYDGIRYQGKVIMLTDRGTFSAGSFTALATKALDHMKLIGDTTGGGLGIPNGGQLPNGWTYRFSISQTLTLDKKPDYEQGVPPDIVQYMDWTDRSRDKILDRAIAELQ